MECWLRAKCTFWSMMITHCWSRLVYCFAISCVVVAFFFSRGKWIAKRSEQQIDDGEACWRAHCFGVCVCEKKANGVVKMCDCNENAMKPLSFICFSLFWYINIWSLNFSRPFFFLKVFETAIKCGCFLFPFRFFFLIRL